MNKLFYIIYNSYYKHGEYKNDIPSLTVGGIFLIFFYSIIKSVLIIVGWINPVYYQINFDKPLRFLFFVLYGFIVYFLFYYKKRYKSIYNMYKENEFLNSKKGKILGFCSVILVIVLPIILGIVRNKIVHGYWV